MLASALAATGHIDPTSQHTHNNKQIHSPPSTPAVLSLWGIFSNPLGSLTFGLVGLNEEEPSGVPSDGNASPILLFSSSPAPSHRPQDIRRHSGQSSSSVAMSQAFKLDGCIHLSPSLMLAAALHCYSPHMLLPSHCLLSHSGVGEKPLFTSLTCRLAPEHLLEMLEMEGK